MYRIKIPPLYYAFKRAFDNRLMQLKTLQLLQRTAKKILNGKNIVKAKFEDKQ